MMDDLSIYLDEKIRQQIADEIRYLELPSE